MRFVTTFLPTLRRGAAATLLLLSFTSVALARADRKFTTPNTLSIEARTLVNVLEEAHYNRDAVHKEDYEQVIPNYMSDLDGQHLFFLQSDKRAFDDLYAKNIYWNIRDLGNIDPAYDMFNTYEARATARINWIFNELKKNFDLTATDNYRVDRTKSAWPASPSAADALWHERLKFELISELLNKKTLPEAKETVRKRYERVLKNIAEIEGSDLAELYLSNVGRLYDPHTTYFSADTFQDFGIQMNLQLVGIGALLGIEDDNCLVKEIVPGGPADLSKQLKPNDKIIAVSQEGGEPVEVVGMKLRKVVEMIRGTKGTKVILTLQPADATDPSTRKVVTLTRDVVKLNSARAHAAIFQVPGPDGLNVPLGVISLPSFYGPGESDDPDADNTTASKDVARLIGELKTAGVKGIVLDLRHNGGGFLSEAIDIVGLFIRKGPVVQVRYYSGEVQVDNDNNAAVAYDGPLAVLVDRFSASASEIVTGALQNYGRAIVVGDTSTHGKGSVQTIFEMKKLVPQLAHTTDKTGAVKFTIQKYYLPNGSSTQLKGVVPDIVLPSIDDYLPIGEGSLPHALAWDEIPSSVFDGAPLDAKVLKPLRESSLERQHSLEEFRYLQKNIDWFKVRQEQKLVSLNLMNRRHQKEADDAFRKQMDAEKARLAKNDFTFKEFRLGPPLPPKPKPAKKADSTDDDDDSELSTDSEDSYGKVDVHLRETLRVLNDAISLGQNHQYWASNHAPLTLAVDPKS